MMRIAIAVFLVLHGIAHGVGFAGAWQLGDFRDAPLDTTLLAGRIDVGVAGIRTMGVLWLLTGITFAVAGIAVWRGTEWWPSFTAGVAAFSVPPEISSWGSRVLQGC